MRPQFSPFDEANKLYRDPRHGKIMGVCAGLACRFDKPRWQIRLGALAALWLLTVPALLVYFGLGFFLDKRPRWSHY